MKISFPKPTEREPSKKEMILFNQWVKYLKDSKLSCDQIYSRAADYTSKNMKIK